MTGTAAATTEVSAFTINSNNISDHNISCQVSGSLMFFRISVNPQEDN